MNSDIVPTSQVLEYVTGANNTLVKDFLQGITFIIYSLQVKKSFNPPKSLILTHVSCYDTRKPGSP